MRQDFLNRSCTEAFLPVQTPWYWPDLNVHLSGRDESGWSEPAHRRLDCCTPPFSILLWFPAMSSETARRSEEVKRRVSNPSFGKLIEATLGLSAPPLHLPAVMPEIP